MSTGHLANLIRFIVLFISFSTFNFQLSTPALGQPITTADAVGHTLTLSRPASRIVSLAPSITEILFALGLDEEIAGVTAFCDYPPQAREKPRVGGLVNPDLERLVGMQPDLILGVKDLHSVEIVGALKRLHLPLYITDPVSVDHILKDIKVIGRLVDRVPQAEALITKMQQRMQEIQARIGSHLRPKVLYVLWSDPLLTVGPGSFIGELIEMAGGRNIAPANRKGYVRIGMEEVLSKDPDIVIFASEMGEGMVMTERKRWRRWSHLAAVRNDRLYAVDSDLLHRPGPRIVEGLEALAVLFHPERFETETR